jgi:hypothetical protein
MVNAAGNSLAAVIECPLRECPLSLRPQWRGLFVPARLEEITADCSKSLERANVTIVFTLKKAHG